MAYILVKYKEDHVLHVVEKRQVRIWPDGTKCSAKYSDGCFYEASILNAGTLEELRNEKMQLLKDNKKLSPFKCIPQNQCRRKLLYNFNQCTRATPPKVNVPEKHDVIEPVSMHIEDKTQSFPVYAQPTTVQPSQAGKYNKKHFCFYCKNFYIKFARHLEHVHKTEEDVIKVLSYPKGSSERKKIIEAIRKKGDFLHNTDPFYNDGTLIVSRRPQEGHQKGPDDFVVCIGCKNFYSRRTIYRHYRRCNNHLSSAKHKFQVEGRKFVTYVHPKANAILRRDIIPILRPGPVAEAIKYDELIILYGNKLSEKYRETHLLYHIRQTLRSIGKLLVTVKQINPNIEDLASLYEPIHYDIVLQAVNKIAKLDERTHKYKIPSLATSLGTLIKKCGKLLITECIKSRNNFRKLLVKDFLKIHDQDYGSAVNKTALENQTEIKRNKPLDLPIQEDVKKLNLYLKSCSGKYYDRLCKKFNYFSWLNLAKCTLTAVQIFNRRRAGEIERLLISDYQHRQAIDKDKHSDVYRSLTNVERRLAENYVRIEIRGKLGRSVPILLSNEQVKIIDLLLTNRSEARVPETNPYVFGYKNAKQFLRACELLRHFSTVCGAKNPESLRGTKLRKQIATVVQILNLKDSEFSHLTNFMGHDEKIHKDHYRLPSTAIQTGQLSKLFVMMQKGTMEKHRGKTLEEVNLDESDDNENNTETSEKCIASTSTSTLHCLSDRDNTPKKKKQKKPIETSEKCIASTSTSTLYHLSDSDNTPKKKKQKKRIVPMSPVGKIVRRPWTTPERHAARDIFRSYLENYTLPSGQFCQEIIQTKHVFRNRTAVQLKAYINNLNKRKQL